MNTLYIKNGEIKERNLIVIETIVTIEEEGQEPYESPSITYCPSHEMLVDNGWVIYVEPGPTLEYIKLIKLQEIDTYDHSEEVNSFLLNGVPVWLPKADRVGLMNSINIEKLAGRKTSTLWFNNIMILIDCDQVILMLAALEIYALDCYNVTASHKFNVDKLETIEEVEAYDYTVNYPDKLIINI